MKFLKVNSRAWYVHIANIYRNSLFSLKLCVHVLQRRQILAQTSSRSTEAVHVIDPEKTHRRDRVMFEKRYIPQLHTVSPLLIGVQGFCDVFLDCGCISPPLFLFFSSSTLLNSRKNKVITGHNTLTFSFTLSRSSDMFRRLFCSKSTRKPLLPS